MDSERRERAKSIRAARDWLTGAERALAGEDDLAGDLKLMLARAELARIAASRRARLRRWAVWLLPPAVAVVWALLSWTPPAAERAAHSLPPPPLGEPAQAASAGVDMSAASTVPPAVQEHAVPHAPPETSPPPAAAPTPQQTAAAAPSTEAQRRVPSADMQRLMQVGGKILRE